MPRKSVSTSKAMPHKGQDVPSAMYKNGDRTMCFQSKFPDPTLYESVVLQTRQGKSGTEYFVKYEKWPAKYNEWVPESQMLSRTDENLAIADGIKLSSNEENKNKKPPPKSGASKRKPTTTIRSDGSHTGSTGASGQNKYGERRDEKASRFVEKEMLFEGKQEVNIPIPNKLKGALCDDWNFIVQRREWFAIPAQHTVDSILSDYVRNVAANEKEEVGNAIDLSIGIKEYFNMMLVRSLLYRPEVEQLYQMEIELGEKGKAFDVSKMSAVYGSHHLLRLFTKLGRCVMYTALDTAGIERLITNLDAFFKFLENNFEKYFPFSDYNPGDPEDLELDPDALIAEETTDNPTTNKDVPSEADANNPGPSTSCGTSDDIGSSDHPISLDSPEASNSPGPSSDPGPSSASGPSDAPGPSIAANSDFFHGSDPLETLVKEQESTLIESSVLIIE